MGSTVEDNVVNCPVGVSPAAANYSMGVVIRNDGLHGGNRVRRNRIIDCRYEAIVLEGASGDTIQGNTILCRTSDAPGRLCGYGIALVGRLTVNVAGWNRCGAAPSSDNVVADNVITAERITAPIMVYGNGPARRNVIRGNLVDGVSQFGIVLDGQVQRGRLENELCAVTATHQRWLQGENVVLANTIHTAGQGSGAASPLLLVESHGNRIVGNVIRSGATSATTPTTRGDGVRVNGSFNRLDGNAVSGVGGHAFNIRGTRNVLGRDATANVARQNAGCDVRFCGGGANVVPPMVASDNGGRGCGAVNEHATPLVAEPRAGG